VTQSVIHRHFVNESRESILKFFTSCVPPQNKPFSVSVNPIFSKSSKGFNSISKYQKEKPNENVANSCGLNFDFDSAMTKLIKRLVSVVGDVTSACIKLLSVGMTSLLHI